MTQIPTAMMPCDDKVLSHFEALLSEHTIMCRLVTGHKSLAIQEVTAVVLLSCLTFFALLNRYIKHHECLWVIF